MENGYESLRKIEKLCKTDDVVYTIERFSSKQKNSRKFLNKGTVFAKTDGIIYGKRRLQILSNGEKAYSMFFCGIQR